MFSSRSILGVLVVLTLALGLGGPALAQSGDWQFRLMGQWVTGSGDDVFVSGGLDDGVGVYLGLERRITDRWGVELGVGWSELEGSEQFGIDFLGLSARASVEASADWVPVSLAANFHLTPQREFDLYVAGRVGWAVFDDVEVVTDFEFDFGPFPGPPIIVPDEPESFRYSAEDTVFYGLRFGGDWPVGDGGWHLTGALDVTFLELEFNSEARDELGFPIDVTTDLDPVSVGFGVSKRW